MAKNNPLEGVLTNQSDRVANYRFLIVPPQSPRYREYAGYRCVGAHVVESMSFISEATHKYKDKETFKIFGATPEICEKFNVPMSPEIEAMLSKAKPKGRPKKEDKADDGEKEG